jgi:hypothetical protein
MSKVSMKPPRANVLVEASHHGFFEGPPKMVVMPLMPKSLAKVKPM